MWREQEQVYGAEQVGRQLGREQIPAARCTVERLMKALQEPVGDAPPGEWWAVMEPVFHLS